MCGICGIVLADLGSGVEAARVEQMCRSLLHRGPDEAGYFISGNIGLGMRRLSIIDVSGGSQPIGNEDGTVQVVYNGEIYNYRELRAELEARGHRFRTSSDTEVIAHGYEEWGLGCPAKFRGMFGFALWDLRARSLLLAIDRLGIKPLYYRADDRGLMFGSELKALLAGGGFRRELDDQALAEFFQLGYIPGPRTIYRTCQKLPPGHRLHWRQGAGWSIQPYWEWRPDGAARPQPRTEILRELRERLRDSVRAHLMSEVPLGAFLSGGMDSSTVVALMSEMVADRVQTFSIGFSDPAYSELGRARLTAKRFHTDHHEIVLEPQSADLLPRVIGQFDEPFADSSALPTYFVSQLASRHVKVALSGDGGDELFVGYRVFLGLEASRLFEQAPRWMRRAVPALMRLVPYTPHAKWNERLSRFKKRVADTMLPAKAAFRSKTAAIEAELLASLLTPAFRDQLARTSGFRAMEESLAAAERQGPGHPLASFLYAIMKVSLPFDFLVKVDRMSMAHSLEVRVPLLDNRLLDFVSGIPIAQLFAGHRLKGLLKDAMADLLPPEIIAGPKRGFNVPLAAWFDGGLVGFARETLLSAPALNRGWWDARALRKFLEEQQATPGRFSRALWTLLVLELWCQQEPLGSPCAF